MKNRILIIYFALFLLHQVVEKYEFSTPFIDSYLDDFLFLPILIFTVEKVISLLSKTRFELTLSQLRFLIIYVIVVVEVVFPILSSHFIFDYWDFLGSSNKSGE